MTKRNGGFDQKTSKKLKLDDDIDALWGDDLDEDALEDCIKLATQVDQQDKITCTQLNNVTLLPTYSAFKQKNELFTSTQVQFDERPSTSRYKFVPKKLVVDGELENKIVTLQQECKEKEGEVSILRTKLQESKVNFQVEQQKLQNEMKQKLTHTERQMKSVKSELEFKNLEIANLKQKIQEITKYNILDTSVNVVQINNTTSIQQENLTVNELNRGSEILQPILDPIYPLKSIISDKIFNTCKREQHITETKLIHSRQNVIPYLQNQLLTSNVVMDKSDLDITCIYPNILKLMYCTEEDLIDTHIVPHLNMIICACEQYMCDLQRFLERIKNNLRTEDILEADSRYLKDQNIGFNNRETHEKDEIGAKVNVLLNLLAELLPYSDYMKQYVCQNKPLIFQEDTIKVKNQFSYHVNKNQATTTHYFLNAILNIIRLAGEIRKVNFMSKFLNTTIKLLINIHKSRNYNYVSDIFCKLTKEIILSRPSVEVIHKITLLIKVASQQSSFVEFLLQSNNSATRKKEILYFNKDACSFYIFVMLFNNSIFGRQNDDFPLSVCLNLLCFMYNTFKTCYWIHHRDAKECECIPELYKLEIEIVSKALERYIEETKKMGLKSSGWAQFFKNPIAAKVLNLIMFNAYEITEKYISPFSQYKQIEKTLEEEDDLIELEKLNITDEIVELSSDAFANVDF